MRAQSYSAALLACLIICQMSVGVQFVSSVEGTGGMFAAQVYTSSPPIEIVGDANLTSEAVAHGWSGSGSLESPYIITGLNITSTSGDGFLVSIEDTTLHFSLEDCLLVGGSIGVRFENVTNGRISGNTIRNAEDHGVFLGLCVNSSVADNTIRSNGRLGILVDLSGFSQFDNNTVTANLESGIKLRDSHNNSVAANTIYDNAEGGLVLGHSLNCTIEENLIYENSLRGISLEASSPTIVVNNTVYNHTEVGILFEGSYGASLVKGNTFYRNSLTGLRIFSRNVTVIQNNFIDNGPHPPYKTQVFDHTEDSSFLDNFWSDWIGPDDNSDGIVDIPYTLQGSNTSLDETPRTSVYLNHYLHILTRPAVFFPNESLDLGFYHGIMNVTWGQSSDTFGHGIVYSVYFSVNDGESWALVVPGVENTFYLWNTTAIAQNLEYEVKVVAECSHELDSEHVTGVEFTVSEHIVHPPTVNYPNGTEAFYSDFEAWWTTSYDTWNHEVSYSVYVSADEGASWVQVVEYTFENSTYISIDDLPDSTYLLKIVANGSCGLMAEDTSDAGFAIQYNLGRVLRPIAVIAVVAIAIIAIVYVLRRRKTG
ncbi:MAG: right-handed parallel beta-helix repeat-containing protein [Candidatus Thorarchaeota archaeon]